MTVDPRWEENKYGIIKDKILKARKTEIILVWLFVCILGITTRVLQTWARAGCLMTDSWWAHNTFYNQDNSSPVQIQVSTRSKSEEMMTRTTRTFNKISYNEAEFFFDILQHIKIITILWVVFLLASFAIFIGKRKQILF